MAKLYQIVGQIIKKLLDQWSGRVLAKQAVAIALQHQLLELDEVALLDQLLRVDAVHWTWRASRARVARLIDCSAKHRNNKTG